MFITVGWLLIGVFVLYVCFVVISAVRRANQRKEEIRKKWEDIRAQSDDE